MTTPLSDRDYQIIFRRTKQTDDEKKFFRPVPDVGINVRPPIDISFSCERTLKSDPNTFDLKVYNLAPATRAELESAGVVLRFDAGYREGGPRLMFVGDVHYANSELKGTEWVSEISVGDGMRAFAQSRVNKSFKRGTKIIEVLQFVAQAMSLTVPVQLAVTKDLQAEFASGFAMSGKSRNEMDRLLAPFGYSWSIQNGVLRVLRDEDVVPGARREISVKTGMIGSPEFGKPDKSGDPPKRTINVQLYPELQPGEVVNVISRDIEGPHKIIKVKHTGDTRSDEWKTQLEVNPIGQAASKKKHGKGGKSVHGDLISR